MTDYETRSRVGMGLEILKLTRQLNEAIEQRDLSLSEHSKTMRQLAECQAREDYYRAALEMFIMPMPDKDTTVMDVLLASTEAAMEALALPSDSTALDTMLKQAKREALLEAADYLLKRGYQGNGFELSHDLRRMALEDHPMNQTP